MREEDKKKIIDTIKTWEWDHDCMGKWDFDVPVFGIDISSRIYTNKDGSSDGRTDLIMRIGEEDNVDYIILKSSPFIKETSVKAEKRAIEDYILENFVPAILKILESVEEEKGMEWVRR